MQTIFKVFIEFVTTQLLLFHVLVFGHKACGILVSQLGIEPAPPVLEDEVLTTGPPGTSLCYIIDMVIYSYVSFFFFFLPSQHYSIDSIFDSRKYIQLQARKQKSWFESHSLRFLALGPAQESSVKLAMKGMVKGENGQKGDLILQQSSSRLEASRTVQLQSLHWP